MSHITEINGLMMTIMNKLMPLCGKDSDRELWAIYNELEEWKMDVEPHSATEDKDGAIKTAQHIMVRLEHLSDKALSKEIEQILIRYTPQITDSLH